MCRYNIEVGQMTGRAVKEKAEHLLERLFNRRALGVLAYGTEKAVAMRKEVDVSQIANEKVEPCLPRQAVVCNLEIVDEI